MSLPTSAEGGSLNVELQFKDAAALIEKADCYMGDTIRRQYKKLSTPSGVYGVQCTEGAVKFSAEVARVRALNSNYRQLLRSPLKKYFDMYENRRAAIAASSNCHYEEKLFCAFPKASAAYNLGKSEAEGACMRYALPETVEEASMMRFMDIQQNNAANPSGVYNMSCNEGTVKGQADDVRIAALNTAYRSAQRPIGQIMQGKYNQRKYGYTFANGCNYEESLINKYPALGATFRSRTYGR